MYVYYTNMREKRIRTKLFSLWLHEKELNFIKDYSDKSLMTSSEVVRSLIKQLMKQEGIQLKEPRLEIRN